MSELRDFVMPSLGADMDAGTLLEWRVKPGDRVSKGDIVAVIETDKAAVEIECFMTGAVERLIAEKGTKISVGTPMMQVRVEGDTSAKPVGQPVAQPTPTPVVAKEVAPPTPTPAATIEAGGVRASPAAKRRARALNVSLATLKGSGQDGAITIEDVEKAGRAPRRDMRGAIAALMERSKREIPHYYLAHDIDMTNALAWLEALNERVDVSERMIPAALFLKAVAVAARAVTAMNGSYAGDRFEPSANVHLGVAVSLREGGLLVPAIHDVDKKTPREVMSALSDVVERARRGMLRGSELTDATLTVTNLGEAGADTVYGVIFPPQVAIVGLGRVTERPAAVEGKVAVRSFVTATVAADHRASDGHLGARFLAAIERALQAPEAL